MSPQVPDDEVVEVAMLGALFNGFVAWADSRNIRVELYAPAAPSRLASYITVPKSLAEQREQYCGGGMTDIGSHHAPHDWAQDPKGRHCPGRPR